MQRYLYLMPMLGGPGAPRYPLTEKVQLIGRSEKAEIPLFEPTVSRQHATIQLKGDHVELRDIGSKHGTYVNTRRISTFTLRVGDIIVVGLSLVLRLEESAEEIPPVEPLKMSQTFSTYDSFVTAIRDTDKTNKKKKKPSRIKTKSKEEQNIESLCRSVLPEVQIRLIEIHRTLQQVVDQGQTAIDPYPVLASVESIMASMEKLWSIAGTRRAKPLTYLTDE